MLLRADTDAGKAAFDYYDHSLSAWRRHMSVPLACSFVLAFGLAVPMWMFVPHGPLFAAFTVGGVYGMVAWLWTEPPEFIAKWKRGAEGERKTGRVLRRLEPEWQSVHGREAKYGDLDHIVVGPGGVFVLDSKNLTGSITLDEQGLTAMYGFSERDSYTHTTLSGAMGGRAAELKEKIQSATGLTYFVHPVVVVWGDFSVGEGKHGGVDYIGGDRLEAWLRRQRKRLSPRDAELIRLGLEAEIIVARAKPLLPPATA
jgi:hypothetical protein